MFLVRPGVTPACSPVNEASAPLTTAPAMRARAKLRLPPDVPGEAKNDGLI